MTATEELRKLLDERGVEHYDGTESTLWGHGYRYAADEISGGYMQVRMFRITPAQAIEATLGHGELERENAKLRELLRVAITYCVNGYCGKDDGCPLRLTDYDCQLLTKARELGVEAEE